MRNTNYWKEIPIYIIEDDKILKNQNKTNFEHSYQLTKDKIQDIISKTNFTLSKTQQAISESEKVISKSKIILSKK